MDENQKADIIYHSSTDTLFYNSQCLFIEFHDVIEMPWLMLAYMLRNDKNTQKIFKIDELSSYSIQDFVEWYIYRKHRNIFKSIGVRDEINDKSGDVPDEWYDYFLYNCMTNSEGLYMFTGCPSTVITSVCHMSDCQSEASILSEPDVP